MTTETVGPSSSQQSGSAESRISAVAGGGSLQQSASTDTRISTAIEWIGICIPIGAVFLFSLSHAFGSVFLSAYGSGGLLASAALVALTILSPAAETRHLIFVGILVALALVGQGALLQSVADSKAETVGWGALMTWDEAPIWCTVILYIGVAFIRYRALGTPQSTSRTQLVGFGKDD